MRWPYAPIGRRDIVALAFCLAIAVLLFLVAAKIPNIANTGFGPGWNCEKLPQGEAVCVKRLPENSAPKPEPKPH
jgi:hypothetical protein